MGESYTGRLLVATPVLVDPNFVRTVILVLDHDEDGALGVVLNRPGDVHVDVAMPGWGEVVAAPSVLFVGGPVEPTSVVALGRSRAAPNVGGWEPIFERVRVVDPSADPILTASEVAPMRLFAGYSGWAPGQLEDEIDEGAWVAIPASPTDPFDPAPDDLWERILRRQGGGLALLSTFPRDPSLN